MLRSLKKRQTGVTLFEVLLVLFVAAFIAAAVATIYSKVTLTYKQNQLQTSVQQLAANISAAYTSPAGANYAGIKGEDLVAAGLVPPELYTGTPSSPTLINPWVTSAGWSVAAVTGGSEGSTTASEYAITLIDIPAAACSSMYPSLSQMSTAAPLEIDGAAPTGGTTGVLAACAADNVSLTLTIY